MRASVVIAFPPWSETFEGSVPHFYRDIDDLVTIGIGNLVDSSAEDSPTPWAPALSLPMLRVDGSPATQTEIVSEWGTIKHAPGLGALGWREAAKYAKLHLSKEGIAELVRKKLRSNEAILKGRFPAWESWCADAQLAVCSQAWACGAEFHFPRLAKALNERDWTTAARECHIEDSHNPGVTPRNKANVLLYEIASLVEGNELDPEKLYYPNKPLISEGPTSEHFPVPPPDDLPNT